MFLLGDGRDYSGGGKANVEETAQRESERERGSKGMNQAHAAKLRGRRDGQHAQADLSCQVSLTKLPQVRASELDNLRQARHAGRSDNTAASQCIPDDRV